MIRSSMSRGALTIVATFALCAVIGWAGGGCFLEECGCPPAPALPARLAPKLISGATVGSGASVGPELTLWTMEIKDDRVFFRYDNSGVNYQVVYRVHPHP